MIKKITFLFLVFMAVSLITKAQEVLQNTAPSLKWRQLNSPNFRILFTEGFEHEAQRVANVLETIHEPETLGDKPPKKIPIVLRNQNAVSNGFVTLGPRRSEFYTMPPQDNQFLGTNEWLDLLAVHEYRHIAQFQQSKSGFNKIFYYLFGENTQAGMAFSAAPRWFWEGDATTVETINTRSGRGRIPEFSRVFKTNLLEKKKYNYHKQHLRSFKDFIPDHYRLGYYFVSHISRRTQDPEIWDKVSHSAFSWPFVPFTFSNSLKKHTGDYLVDNYNQMMGDVKEHYEQQVEGLEASDFTTLSKRRNDAFADYSFPQQLEDGSIVAFKSGIGDVGQLVQLSAEGKEQKRFVTGVMNSTGMLSSTQSKVFWNEYHFDPRWRAETYSVIKSYDFTTKKVMTHTKKSRYGGAAVSPDGYKIATVETSPENKHRLLVIDTYSGTVLKQFENPNNDFYSHPRWSPDGQKMVALKTNDSGRSVVLVNYETGVESELIAPGTENIGYPVLTGKYLFFNSPYNGIDNIYALNLATGVRWQVTNSKYGAYNPFVSKDGKTIIYNEHTKDGLDVVKAELNPEGWIPFQQVVDRNVAYYQPLIEQEGHPNILDKVSDNEYPVKKYSQLGHIINVHSWGPFATTDINRAQFGIFSKDILSTTTASLGYTYDVNEETGFGSASVSYQGLFPVLDVEATYGSRKQESGSIKYTWDEKSLETGLRIPLVFTNSRFFRELEVSNSVGIRDISDFKNNIDLEGRLRPATGREVEIDGQDTTITEVPLFRVDSDVIGEGQLLFNHFEASYFSLMKRSARDINSKWGFQATFENFNTVGGDFDGSLTALRGIIFFPGLFKHHSIFFQGGVQTRLQDAGNDIYSFRNAVFRPRGYSYFTDKTFKSIRSNYTLPLWYPDIAFGPFLNVQRIKANLFMDYGQDQVELFFKRQSNDQLFAVRELNNTYLSYGFELTFDINILRFSPLIELGARYVYITANDFNNAGSTIEFIIGNISF